MKTEADYMQDEIRFIDQEIRRKEDLVKALQSELNVCRIKKDALERAVDSFNE